MEQYRLAPSKWLGHRRDTEPRHNGSDGSNAGWWSRWTTSSFSLRYLETSTVGVFEVLGIWRNKLTRILGSYRGYHHFVTRLVILDQPA